MEPTWPPLTAKPQRRPHLRDVTCAGFWLFTEVDSNYDVELLGWDSEGGTMRVHGLVELAPSGSALVPLRL